MILKQHWMFIAACMVAALLISAAFILPALVSAQGQGLPDRIVPNTCSGPDCGFCDLAILVQNILNFATFAVVFWAAIRFAVAGWLYLSNAASPANRTRANSILKNTMIGLVVVLAAWLLIDTLMKGLLGGDFGPWNEACSVTTSSTIPGGEDVRIDFGSF